MTKKLVYTITLFLCISYSGLAQQQVEVIKIDRLEKLIKESDEKVKVINFWATWCAPCIKELPYFEAARQDFSNQISVNLISLDFADQLNKVNRFVERKQLGSNIYLLDEIDYDSWINKVDKSWSGAIPATLIINEKTGERKFVESELKQQELYELIKDLLSES